MGKYFGRCRLCGKEKELTFEHVPPRAVFNKSPLRRYDGVEILDNPEDFENRKLKSSKFNRGSGGHYLCKDCNSFLGSEYNETYSFVASNIACEIDKSLTPHTTGIEFLSKELEWGRFFRQAMSMFVDISDDCSSDDKLREYILNPNSMDFDREKYMLLFYAVNDCRTQRKKIIGKAEIETLKIKFAEITAFTIGFLLLIDENRQIQNKTSSVDFSIIGANITNFCSFDCNCKYQIEFVIPLHHITDSESIVNIFENFYRMKAQEETL